MAGMNTTDPLQRRASELVKAAHAFHKSAEQPGSHVVAPAVLESLEEALQVLSGAWYQLAADASPGIIERRQEPEVAAHSRSRVNGLSREQEVRLMGTLHDVAAAFARCARACREGRSTMTSMVVRRTADGHRNGGDRFPRFQRYPRPTGHLRVTSQ
jgi:hypothetical protein